MSTTDTTTVPATIAVGDTVIAWSDESPVQYGGPSEHGGSTLSFGICTGGLPIIRCDADRVIPADVTVPAKDPRVEVAKRTTREARAAGYYGSGSWSYTIPGVPWTMWARTKTVALADGARKLAILDWHDAQAAAAQPAA